MEIGHLDPTSGVHFSFYFSYFLFFCKKEISTVTISKKLKNESLNHQTESILSREKAFTHSRIQWPTSTKLTLSAVCMCQLLLKRQGVSIPPSAAKQEYKYQSTLAYLLFAIYHHQFVTTSYKNDNNIHQMKHTHFLT